MHICNVRSQVFFPGVWVCLRDLSYFLFFLAALSANLHCGKTLGLEKSVEHGKVFQEYGWETRTFEEGKKKEPFIQGGGLRQAHTIEKVENPSSRLLNNAILVCNLHVNAGILQKCFSILWVTSANCQAISQIGFSDWSPMLRTTCAWLPWFSRSQTWSLRTASNAKGALS